MGIFYKKLYPSISSSELNIVYVIESAAYGVIFTSCLCEKPSLARTSLVRVFTQTTREYNPVRRTFYDVNYIYYT